MSIEEAFHSYYHENDTDVNFTVTEAGRLLEFLRQDQHPDDFYYEYGETPNGFVSFENLMRRYSTWGNHTVDFQMKIDGELKVQYQYTPSEITLPMLLKHLPNEDYQINDSVIFFRKGSAKKVLRELEAELIQFINSKYKEALNA